MSKNTKTLLAFAGVTLISLAVYFILPPVFPEAARRVAAIFVFSALLWAFDIIPLHATSLMAVILLTFFLTKPGFEVFAKDGETVVKTMGKGDYKQFMALFGSPLIMLFLGGFFLAAALNKFRVDEIIAKNLLQLFGDKPYFILLGFILTTAFLSMWMSNTATTAMMLVMIRPILKQLEAGDKFKKALILGIPFGANIGGIGTPVGTPPNAVALGFLENQGFQIDFLRWMVMALPLAIFLLFVLSIVLIFVFPSKQKRLKLVMSDNVKMTSQSWLSAAISILTVVLWLTGKWHGIPSYLVALLAAGLFVSSGLLTKHDIQKIDWNVLILMWGGLALGKAMDVSQLTDVLISFPLFSMEGAIIIFLFAILALVLSTFMSNTATANLLIPIVLSIPGQDPMLMAITVALACSFAMALPISTPPNAMAFTDDDIKVSDMIVWGGLMSLIALGLLLVGFEYVIPMTMGL